MNCCQYHDLPAGCNQGRNCPRHQNPAHSALYTQDGGHTFHRGIGFPIEREEDDKPIATPESAAEPVPRIAQAIVGFIVLVLLAISAFALPALLSH